MFQARSPSSGVGTLLRRMSESVDTSSMDNSQPIVREELIARCLGDEAFAVELLGLFAFQAPGLLEQIRSAAEEERWDDVCLASRALKGLAGNIAA